MKRTSIFYFSLAAIAVGSLVSCQEADLGFDEETIREMALSREFNKNFEDRYGKIDPNHNWGLGVISGDEEVSTRINVSNKNQWAALREEENFYHLSVPGWPDVFMKTDGTQGNNGYHYETTGNLADYGDAEAARGKNPAGDVTDEEIEYVSWWFRTHQNPDNEPVHWTSFFVQEISSDVDRYTSETTTDPDLYGKMVTEANDGKSVSRDDYGIDKMAFGVFEGSGDQDGWSGLPAGWDHNKNFNMNASNSLRSIETLSVTENANLKKWASYMDIDDAKINKKHTEYYTSSGTEDFMADYTSSNIENPKNETRDLNTDGTQKKIWVLVHLVFDGKPDANGVARHYDGYYLGYDFELTKADGTYKPADGYYSNWIVKLSQAEPLESGYSRRIMCEDLGNTYDFDFNDVVFDVTYHVSKGGLEAYKTAVTNGQTQYYDNGNQRNVNDGVPATITIRAAGGTLPIYVGVTPGGDNAKYEAHRLLNNASSTPVNVGGASNAPANYNLTLPLDPGLIPIYVITSSNAAGEVTESIRQIVYKQSQGNNTPQKFGTPITVRWMKEEQFIDWGYPKFKNWVKHADGAWGEFATDYQQYDDEGVTTYQGPWFTHKDDTSKIY